MPETTLVLIAVAAVALLAVVIGAVTLAYLRRLAATRENAAREATELRMRLDGLLAHVGEVNRDLRQDLAIARNEQANAAGALRAEVGERLAQFTQVTQHQMAAASGAQAEHAKAADQRLSRLAEATNERLDAVRGTVETRLDVLRDENARKLDEMRATVDEKLAATLETRLGESFRLVSERLDQVHRGLGEMQSLAAGVGDLKRVLSNVKTRGMWGEVQLGALLADLLTPAQYEQNVATRPGSKERVEYAVRFPGRDDSQPCWLPIDCKFPLEAWQRLQEALERADAAAVEVSRKALEQFFRAQARDIRDKYIAPPYTTDFAILFVPTEGLFAEAVARPGLHDTLQRDYRVSIAGPTTLAAMLNSLQLGFRTLAIERRSTEVWRVLGAIKTDFGKFAEILAKTQKKLQEASNTIDEARGKSTTIVRRLRDVEAIPHDEAVRLLDGEPASVDAPLGGDEPTLLDVALPDARAPDSGDVK
jgi:DNA recombination protein RmuC